MHAPSGEVMTLRKNLIDARKKHKITVVEAAQRVGVRQRMYYYYENGEKDPSLSVALKLEKLYKVPISELLVQYPNTESVSAEHEVLENSTARCANGSIGRGRRVRNGSTGVG